jgi:hypothetical protein
MRRIVHSTVGGVLGLLPAACSSGGSAGSGAPAPIVVLDEREATLSAAMGEHVVAENATVATHIAAPPAKVYEALLVAFSDVVATATDIGGTSTRMPCGTTGDLELRIQRAVTAAVGG